MANIATLLARILTTRYGKDMRQDLHDAIEAVNNDVETCGQTVSVSGNQLSLKRGSTTLSTATLPSGVSSVNNKTGAVTLTASDVGAATSSDIKNGTLTIQKNGTTVQTFGANESTNKTANITVPTKVSDLTNDSGFSSVSVNQIKSSGEKIAEITVDGTKTDIFASAGGGGGDVTSVNGMQGDVVLDVDDINDVQISSLQSGQILKYNGSKWVNANESGGAKPNLNLLSNGWFKVNTTGKTSWDEHGNGYVDMINGWKGYRGTLTQTSGGVTMSSTFSAGLRIQQTVPNLTSTDVLTLSININGTIYSSSSLSNWQPITNMYINRTNSANGVTIDIRWGTTATSDAIRAVKLEFGTESTLAYDTEPIGLTDIIADGDTSAITSNAVYDSQEIMAKHEDGSTSSKAYAIGDYFIRGGKYCKCISAIASGGTFTKNTNYQETDIGAQIKATNTALSGKQDALTFTSTPSSSNKVVCLNDVPSVPSTVTGTFTADTSNVEYSNVKVKQYGNVVAIYGYCQLKAVSNVTQHLGTISGVSVGYGAGNTNKGFISASSYSDNFYLDYQQYTSGTTVVGDYLYFSLTYIV